MSLTRKASSAAKKAAKPPRQNLAVALAEREAELAEARSQQAATARILRVISQSPTDVGPVFEAILDAGQRLFGSDEIGVYAIGDDDMVRVAAWRGPRAEEVRRDVTPLAESVTGRIIRERRTRHIPDLRAEPDLPPTVRERVERLGSASLLYAPMLWEDRGLGSIIVARSPPKPFSEREQTLLQTFADQAAIAIENARLFHETREALEHQKATSDVLQVISRSTFDLNSVFRTLVENAVRLCGARTGMIFQRDGEIMRLAAAYGATAEFVSYVRDHPIAPGRGTVTGRAALEGRTVHFLDIEKDPEYSYGGRSLERYRSIVGVPLMRDRTAVGVFTLWRHHVEAFTPRQIALVETFADQAVIAIENARMFEEVQARTRDLEESLEQQTATADVLKAISRSAFDLETVLESLISTALRLCNAKQGVIFRRHGDIYRYAASHMLLDPAYRAHEQMAEIKAGRGTLIGRVALENRTVQIEDAWNDPDYAEKDEVRRGKVRSMLGVPLLRNGEPIGAFGLGREEPVPFTPRQIDLVTTFADQAVIAIENVRLFDEVQAKTRDLEESLQQQTATADVLKAISRTAFDLDTVLQTLISTAVRLCDASGGEIFRRHGDVFRYAASLMDLDPAYLEHEQKAEIRPGRGTLIGRVAVEKRTVEIADAWNDREYAEKEQVRVGRVRAMLGVPLMRNGELIGAFALGRPAPVPFTKRQVELVTTFADQAVIAIENVRLFDEVQARTRDLEEALAQQTATAEVLKVISRSAFDLQAVFDTLISSAVDLVGGVNGTIFVRDGESFPARAHSGVAPEFARALAAAPPTPGRQSVTARVLLSGQTECIADVLTDKEYTLPSNALNRTRSLLATPLLREDRIEGVLVVGRSEPGEFTQRQIDLVQTFADQAVIAIENVRLFDEVQAKTRDLEEALAQQTATAEVLKVISRSAFDLQAVFETLVKSAVELVGASGGALGVREGDQIRFRTSVNIDPDVSAPWMGRVVPLDRATVTGRAVLSGRLEYVPDADKDLEYHGVTATAPGRSLLAVPLARDGRAEGAITLAADKPNAFSPRHFELVQTFADQAVIAIENVRLFDEVQARTRDLAEALQMQTATSDVLKVISRSAFDLQTVFNTLVSSAVELGGALTGTICVRDGDVFRYRDTIGAEHTSALAQYLRDHPATPGRSTIAGRVLLSGKVERIPDCLADPEYVVPMGSLATNVRSLLGVPLLRKEGVEGAIILTRTEPGEFTDRQIEIVQTFADQAVIALENVRLFDEVQARTKELAASLDDLRKAQDRLIQSEKLASLGQLTAGIAHEIKNPLNFVNNFSALSRELVGELADMIKAAPLDDARRKEAEELIGTIDGNLDKVVSHGKRANSIVKNMLLHSREGSGERSTTNVNAMVEEALNLAYHGMRAEKPGFNVAIVKSLDSNAGTADVYAQETTRVLLNLISNGFYATSKRKSASGDAAYEPTITASTRDLGHSVEIAIRDNGVGIPDEVKAKMFNPFFTTKPAGEGTGLGLSLSHDIVVKQHGGTIEASSEPGAYTQFTIVLPRAGAKA